MKTCCARITKLVLIFTGCKALGAPCGPSRGDKHQDHRRPAREHPPRDGTLGSRAARELRPLSSSLSPPLVPWGPSSIGSPLGRHHSLGAWKSSMLTANWDGKGLPLGFGGPQQRIAWGAPVRTALIKSFSVGACLFYDNHLKISRCKKTF